MGKIKGMRGWGGKGKREEIRGIEKEGHRIRG